MLIFFFLTVLNKPASFSSDSIEKAYTEFMSFCLCNTVQKLWVSDSKDIYIVKKDLHFHKNIKQHKQLLTVNNKNKKILINLEH